MARPKLGETETERLQIKITTAEIEAIDDWRYRKRVPSKSEAVRRLCRIALVSEDLRPSINQAMKALLDPVMLLSNEMLVERPRKPEEMEELAELARHVFSMCFDLYGKVLEHEVRAAGLSNGETDFEKEMDLEKRTAEFLSDGPFLEKLRKSPEARRYLRDYGDNSPEPGDDKK
jgi:hypothetical protein